MSQVLRIIRFYVQKKISYDFNVLIFFYIEEDKKPFLNFILIFFLKRLLMRKKSQRLSVLRIILECFSSVSILSIFKMNI